MELEKRLEAIKKAYKHVEGTLTIKKYIELSEKYNLPSIYKIRNGYKWKELKIMALGRGIYAKYQLEDAIAAAEMTKKVYGKLTLKNYALLTKNNDKYPSKSWVAKRYKWIEFKEVVEGNKEADECLKEDQESYFCNMCMDKKDCEIELEDCEYWEEWQNEHSRKANC